MPHAIVQVVSSIGNALSFLSTTSKTPILPSKHISEAADPFWELSLRNTKGLCCCLLARLLAHQNESLRGWENLTLRAHQPTWVTSVREGGGEADSVSLAPSLVLTPSLWASVHFAFAGLFLRETEWRAERRPLCWDCRLMAACLLFLRSPPRTWRPWDPCVPLPSLSGFTLILPIFFSF